jgi:hypothetical protein
VSKLKKIQAVAVLKTMSATIATGKFVDTTTDKVREGGKKVKGSVSRKVHYAKAVKTAMQAGNIVGKCQAKGGNCRLDDENEEVIPCWRHEEEIARLAEINETDYNESQEG